MKKSKIGFISLGCPKNLIDTEIMLNELYTAGYEITPEETEADIIIINTCAFTESAKQESIDTILDAAWLKTNAKCKGLIVTGCMSERYREELKKELPECDAVIGIAAIHDIVEAVKAVEKNKFFEKYGDIDNYDIGGDRLVTTPEYMAYLKIAEGCDNKCAYCAIPSIRGKFRSRTMEDIVKEAKNLEALGVLELTLVAQDTTRYGVDLYGEYKLAELIRKITAETNIPWIRLLYCYPDKITDELVEEIKNNDRVVKYIDMPIQHISENMLKAMNRHGGQAVIKSAVERLRKAVPDITLRTTVITGFPGETEEDFTELCEYLKETRFDRLGAFTYSREEGTPAYDFEDQIDEQIKQDRCDIIMDMQYDINARNNEKKVGKIIKVLCEGFDPVSNTHFGRSAADAPEIDGKVYFTCAKRLPEGKIYNVKITEVLDYDLIGETK
ncbi:MAG: 30S ribosomal protein S12 methylthiotransferase RimO [Clostridia bacterium]|nr:30S ribosomal protein S12 methylthiotransferase RimO [Clostridia bacterium]